MVLQTALVYYVQVHFTLIVSKLLSYTISNNIINISYVLACHLSEPNQSIRYARQYGDNEKYVLIIPNDEIRKKEIDLLLISHQS